ncbi:MAG TPA: hypothetical protein VFL83_05990 [Anaeromyxobacter sp.]|nr:hypothetical protein [Anaeromyxobacter sp.]
MGRLLFVSQAMLDSWAGQGKIDFVGNVMTLLAGGGKGRSYALDPAVRFLKVVGAEVDPNGLLHKVKTVAQLKEMGAEPVDDSCILGDLAYEVEPGFLAEAAALAAAATAQPARPPPGQPPAPAAPPAPGARPAARADAPPAPGADARARPLGGVPLPKDLEEKRKEAEALARFLLENLS